MKPLKTGLALSATVAFFYTLCTLVEVTWPNQFMGFMNGLFHGLDFRKLMTTDPYHWLSFFSVLVILVVWAFAAGVFFAWIHNVLFSAQGRHVIRHE